MATGIAAATCIAPDSVLRDGSDDLAKYLPTDASDAVGRLVAVAACVAAALPGFLRLLRGGPDAGNDDDRRKIPAAALGGALFAIGLTVSRMTVPSKLLGFLNLRGFASGGAGWDPTLACVMGGGLAVSFASYQFASGFGVLKVRWTVFPGVAKLLRPFFSMSHAIDRSSLGLVLGASEDENARTSAEPTIRRIRQRPQRQGRRLEAPPRGGRVRTGMGHVAAVSGAGHGAGGRGIPVRAVPVVAGLLPRFVPG